MDMLKKNHEPRAKSLGKNGQKGFTLISYRVHAF